MAEYDWQFWRNISIQLMITIEMRDYVRSNESVIISIISWEDNPFLI